MKAQNLDKLSDDAKAMIAWAFCYLVGDVIPLPPYMIEVKLDDPIKNLMEGGNMNSHYGGGSRCYIHHENDSEWAVVHIEDEDWRQYQTAEMVNRGRDVVRQFVPGVDEWEAKQSREFVKQMVGPGARFFVD